jgi:hypothetical protein
MGLYVKTRTSGASLVTALVALACLGTAGPACAADSGASQLSVDYHPPRVSVEARGVTLSQVLSEIGAKVGFTVVDNGASSATVAVSIREASVDQALRQLLRGENHTVLYLAGSGTGPMPSAGIDKIVLLGAPGRTTGEPKGADGQPTQARTDPGPSDRTTSSAAAAPPSAPPVAPAPSTGDSTPSPSWDRAASSDGAQDPASARNTVGDILKTHAMSTAQTAQESTHDAPPVAAGPVNLDAALAETTRRAQQDLSALVDGLETATRALQQSPGHK